MSKRLVKGGMIFDGTGNEPFASHLLIENDRITAVADDKRAMGFRKRPVRVRDQTGPGGQIFILRD